MADTFIGPDFLLETKQARELYHNHAADLPIIDYHCHLPPAEIACDKRWDNIAQVWLYGDHYKWRQMRTAGIAERYCTGNASDREKFDKYAELMPQALRNPLYHWSHLELKNVFGIGDRLLSPATADSIWNDSLKVIASPAFSARGLMKQAKVEVVCTTDDPVDSLEYHHAIAREQSQISNLKSQRSFTTQVRPTWRPDKCWAVANPAVFNAWTDKLAAAVNSDIRDLDGFMAAIRKRHEVFHAHGCRLSDRGISFFPAGTCSQENAATIFAKARAGKPVLPAEALAFQVFMLDELAVMDAGKGWTMQVHYGVLRNNSSRQFAALGPDTGFDSIGDWPTGEGMTGHFDRLDRAGKLPKTILYNINPRDNELIATMIGNYQDGVTPGKMQFGSAWWFMDQLDGMTRQIEALSQLGLLSRFVGMLTDSRSFLSYARHEYFRRLLCNILGNDMACGRIPNDMTLVGRMVEDICYRNARNYFGFFDDSKG
jgi:glucuronate isomerase